MNILPTGIGRALMNKDAEAIAREVFPELVGAREGPLSRRMGDVRDVLDELPCPTVSMADRTRIAQAYARMCAR